MNTYIRTLLLFMILLSCENAVDITDDDSRIKNLVVYDTIIVKDTVYEDSIIIETKYIVIKDTVYETIYDTIYLEKDPRYLNLEIEGPIYFNEAYTFSDSKTLVTLDTILKALDIVKAKEIRIDTSHNQNDLDIFLELNFSKLKFYKNKNEVLYRLLIDAQKLAANIQLIPLFTSDKGVSIGRYYEVDTYKKQIIEENPDTQVLLNYYLEKNNDNKVLIDCQILVIINPTNNQTMVRDNVINYFNFKLREKK